MRNLSVVCGVVMALLIGGCGGPRMSQAEFDAADFGLSINQSRAQAIVQDYFASTLKDPSSAQYRNISVYKIYSDGVFGYLICASVNAKNVYGGYVGYQKYGLVTRNGKVIEVQSENADSRNGYRSLDDDCKR